jgi:hypothetical protein
MNLKSLRALDHFVNYNGLVASLVPFGKQIDRLGAARGEPLGTAMAAPNRSLTVG